MEASSGTLPNGLSYKDTEGEDGKRLRDVFFVNADGVMRVEPAGWNLPSNFRKIANLVYDFKFRADDIWVLSFPKSGTTWIQEIVWTLMFNPNLDNPQSDFSLDARAPTFEGDMTLANSKVPPPDPNGQFMVLFGQLCPGQDIRKGLVLQLAEKLPSPRSIKSHLPLPILPKNLMDTCKCIYVARDPRDIIGSLYHYMQLLELWKFNGTIDEFVNYIIKNEVIFCPYWEHLREAWNRRNHPNLKFVFYEDLKKDTEKEIKAIDAFLGTNRNQQQINNVLKQTSFGSMKERIGANPPGADQGKYYNPEVHHNEGGFFRKGLVGGWKTELSDSSIKKVNEWIKKNVASFSDDFKYKHIVN